MDLGLDYEIGKSTRSANKTIALQNKNVLWNNPTGLGLFSLRACSHKGLSLWLPDLIFTWQAQTQTLVFADVEKKGCRMMEAINQNIAASISFLSTASSCWRHVYS